MANSVWLNRLAFIDEDTVTVLDHFDLNGGLLESINIGPRYIDSMACSGDIFVYITDEDWLINVRINGVTNTFNVYDETQYTLGETPSIRNIQLNILNNGSIAVSGEIRDDSTSLYFFLESVDGLSWTQKIVDPYNSASKQFWFCTSCDRLFYDSSNSLYYASCAVGSEVYDFRQLYTSDFTNFYELAVPIEQTELLLASGMLVGSTYYCSLLNRYDYEGPDYDRVFNIYTYSNGAYTGSIPLTGFLPAATYPAELSNQLFVTLVWVPNKGLCAVTEEILPINEFENYYDAERIFKFSGSAFALEDIYAIHGYPAYFSEAITEYSRAFNDGFDYYYYPPYTKYCYDSSGYVYVAQRYTLQELDPDNAPGLFWDVADTSLRIYNGASYVTIEQPGEDGYYWYSTSAVSFTSANYFWSERVRCIETI